MNFVQRIINAGFIEQGQKRLLELMPHKKAWIPEWWKEYNTSTGWFGLTMDHPDAWFRKEDNELQLSLQGVQTPGNWSGHEVLMQNRAVRYICLKFGEQKIYESFSGEVPPDEIVSQFIGE